MRRFVMLTAALLAVGVPAAAEDRTVAVIERDYQAFGTAAAPDAEALYAGLRQSGMRVTSGTNLVARDVRVALDDLSRPDPEPGVRIVVLSGKFVHSPSDTWLLASDAAAPTLATVDLNGMSLSAVVDLMRDGGDRSVLLLGDASGGVSPGARLSDGIGPVAASGDVHVIAGPPQAIAAAAIAISLAGITPEEVLRNDASLRRVQGGGSGDAPAAVAEGDAPRGQEPSAPAAAGQAAAEGDAPAAAPRAEGRVLEGEAEAWLLAAARPSAASYEEFLRAFPDGRYAEVARTRLKEMGGVVPDPAAPPAAPTAVAPPPAMPGEAQPGAAAAQSARLAEAGMNLSRSERVRVQEQLTRLGYSTRGVDGIFGNGTRAALARWQRDNGLPETGYLDADAAAKLKAQADARRPDGTPLSQSELDWRDAARRDNIASYTSFLEKHPNSPDAEKARNRVRWLTDNEEEIATESGLGMTRDTRRLIEERLEAVGLKPGKVDGAFNNATRDAIRAYQKSRNLPVTGFMNDSTMLNLLAEAVLAR